MFIESTFVLFQILKLSQNTVGKLTIGHIVNLASNDVHRFDMVSYNYNCDNMKIKVLVMDKLLSRT